MDCVEASCGVVLMIILNSITNVTIFRKPVRPAVSRIRNGMCTKRDDNDEELMWHYGYSSGTVFLLRPFLPFLFLPSFLCHSPLWKSILLLLLLLNSVGLYKGPRKWAREYSGGIFPAFHRIPVSYTTTCPEKGKGLFVFINIPHTYTRSLHPNVYVPVRFVLAIQYYMDRMEIYSM